LIHPALAHGPITTGPSGPWCAIAWHGNPIGVLSRLQEPGIPAEGCPPFTVYRFEPTGPSQGLPGASLPTLAATTRDDLLHRLTEHLTGNA
jgi:hypothetical protein